VPVIGHPRKRPLVSSAPAASAAPSAAAVAALGLSKGELDRMAAGLQGSIVLPGSPSYDDDRQGNPLYPARPAMIVYCKVIEDVRIALGWVRDRGWPFTCRAGGHSTAGFSLSDGVVIDVSGLDGIAIDPVAKQARIGAGARWGPINSTLDTYGLHVPGGGCPTVGVAGYMQGGGYGFTSREFGMNCDNVVEVTLVRADGAVVVADAQHNERLFWAVRGGTGGNFGVLVEIVYRLVPLREMWGFCLRWSADDGAAALAAIQAGFMGAAGDRKVSYQLAIATRTDPATGNGSTIVVMMGMYHGSRADGLRAISGIRGVGSPDLVVDRTSTYAELNEGLIDVLPGIPEAPGQVTLEIKRCGYIAGALSTADWQAVLDYYATTPNPYNIVGIEPYGGAIREPSSPNAFIHRDVSMDFFIDSFYAEQWDHNGADSAQRWIDGFMGTMAPHFNGHVYQNYPWRSLPDYEWAFWGDSVDELRKVKAAVDPGDLFHFEQSIPPATDGPGDIVIETLRPAS
jgi:FAD/FMN-containing dehydrogenase